jgi:hypothetical protein
MLKLQAIFHDGSVGMECMTDDPSEAEEMLAFDCVAEVLVLDEPAWSVCISPFFREFARRLFPAP